MVKTTEYKKTEYKKIVPFVVASLLFLAACNTVETAVKPGAAADSALETAAAGDTGQVWLTTPDRSNLLTQQPDVTFGDGSPGGATINVDASQTFQTMDGFGASITDSSAALLYQLSPSRRSEVMRSIFSADSGIGMSFLRQPIGSSDFVDEPHYTYNDVPANQTDFNMERFSIAHDEAQILPLLREALAINPDIKVMASPWGQPAWMKVNGEQFGSRLKDDPAVTEAYALYLVKFIQAYEDAGVPIYALSVQNEPQNKTPDQYPGTDMPVATQAAVINALGPMLENAGLERVKIMSYDHNWSQFPGDGPEEPNYPYDVLKTSAAQYIDGTAYHCYSGDASAQSALHDAFPDKDIWFTECSGFRGFSDSQAKAFADTLNFHAKNVTIAATRNWAKAVVNWNLVLDNEGKPNNGGCGLSPDGVCTGAVAINGTNVQYNAEYYNLGHMSKFVKPGAVHIGSSNIGDVTDVAFKNPDGSTVLVAHNSGGAQQNFNVSADGSSFNYILPAGGLATFVWDSGDDSTDPTDPTDPDPDPTDPVDPTDPTDPGGPIDTSRSYQVINVNSGKCLDDADFGTANGSALQQWACSSPKADNQLWQFKSTSDGYYQVVSKQAPLVWDVAGGPGATGNGTATHLWTYNSGANQQWKPVAVGGGSYQFEARHSGKCLDVRDVSANNGAQLQQWECTGGPAQQFELR